MALLGDACKDSAADHAREGGEEVVSRAKAQELRTSSDGRVDASDPTTAEAPGKDLAESTLALAAGFVAPSVRPFLIGVTVNMTAGPPKALAKNTGVSGILMLSMTYW
eukprot:CAMPEP_0172928108 /NCGR_PEP_ID=MMETSP1075-20121228/217810_1 /TAXON_ID=2916 /ORGANISM="Ceratium fusus, Strain PA161109" /LENGTH=107 /DNA_ID=CAMNT_0013789387 /DNA_START=592 /DNA_END=915 /DNA_ORIENTATION=-